MATIQFRVNDKPLQFTPKEAHIMSVDGRLDNVWDVFEAQARKVYRQAIKKQKIQPNQLSETGLAHLPSAIPSPLIEEMRQAINSDLTFVDIARTETSDSNVMSSNDIYTVRPIKISNQAQDVTMKIVDTLFTVDFVSFLENYFRSYFSINHVLYSRALPDPNPIVSFRWHRDFGPKSQTHIMVYLDSTQETGGRTAFLNYEDSKKVEKIGYEGISALDKRSVSLDERYSGVEIISPEVNAGDALIFNATRILHKGIHPDIKYRDVLFFILQADLVPYRERLSKETLFSHPSGWNLYSGYPFQPYVRIV